MTIGLAPNAAANRRIWWFMALERFSGLLLRVAIFLLAIGC